MALEKGTVHNNKTKWSENVMKIDFAWFLIHVLFVLIHGCIVSLLRDLPWLFFFLLQLFYNRLVTIGLVSKVDVISTIINIFF